MQRKTLWLATILTLLNLVILDVPAAAKDAEVEKNFDAAFRFYEAGGYFCLSVIAPKAGGSEEAQWTVLLLSPKSLDKPSVRYGDIVPGAKLEMMEMLDAGLAVQNVWVYDAKRFVKWFAEGIAKGTLRGRMVQTAPLKAGDEVLLKDATELTAEQLLAYGDHRIR